MKCLPEGELKSHGLVFSISTKASSEVFPDLSRLIEMPNWRESLAQCKGLYVLSATLKKFLCESVAPRQLPGAISFCSNNVEV